VCYINKTRDTRGEKKEIVGERNGKRQRAENDKTNLETLFSIRLHSHYGACDVSLKLETGFLN
jgi:hypothetical protein